MVNEMNERVSLVGLYTRNIGSGIVGLFTVMLLNIFTPGNPLELQDFFLNQGGWKLLFFVEPLILIIACLFQWILQRPISRLLRLHERAEEIPEPLLEKARRRTLNLPSIFWLFNLILWVVVSFISILYLDFRLSPPLRQTLLLIFRTIMIGLIAANLSFFLVEDHLRKILIPYLFPRGRLRRVKGTIKISILRRIRILYMAGTSVPMIILLGTLSFTVVSVEPGSTDALLLGRNILLFSFVLCILFVIISLRLNFLVGRSILEPIRKMLGIIQKIRDGDYTQRITVLSNDEIGILGDTGNEMIAGLADRERIRETFGKYVTPEIRDQILQGRIPVDGEKAEATLLFSDLRGFTSFVENNDPQEVIRSMKDYFTAMQHAIRTQKGLVLQFVGDEIESVFGVPLRYDGHAEKAVRAALEMRRCLDELNDQRLREGKHPFKHGIGIHTGIVLAGNAGSEDRLSYALIGDTVNLASRIENLTKRLGCDILISESTVKKLRNEYPMIKEPPQMVKGYSKPVTVYRLLDFNYR